MPQQLVYRIFPALFNMSLTAGVIIVAVLIARLALKKAPKSFSYALWAVVLFRLLCPVSVGSAVSLLGLLHAPVEETSPQINAVQYVAPRAPRPVTAIPDLSGGNLPGGDPDTTGQGAPSPAVPVPDGTPPAAETAAPSLTPGVIAAWVWLAGAAAMLLYSAVSLLLLRRRLTGAMRLRDNIWYADHIDTPFVIGLFRPRIYLPSSLAGAESGYILLHEQYHIRHLDHIVKLLSFIALSLHWFNPLVWAAFLLSEKDMEMRCDEAVVKQLGDGVRADYSASLLRLATGRTIVAGTPLAFGEGNTGDRIRNLLRWKRPKTWMVLLAGLACGAVTVACAANPQTAASPPPEEPGPGQYASMEEYAASRVQAVKDGNQISYPYSHKVDGEYHTDILEDTVADARAEGLFYQGKLEGLAPEGTLELWEWTCEVKPTNAENREIFMAGGSYVTEDGYIHDGSELVVALRYADGGRYDILHAETGPEHSGFGAYCHSTAEALHDWYVREYELDLPLYVLDWRDDFTLPDPGSMGNYPVHRFDGDGWYIYIPVSAWNLDQINTLPDSGAIAFSWLSGYGTGSRIAVAKRTESLESAQRLYEEELGLTPTDDGRMIWEYHDDGLFSQRRLVKAPDGGYFEIWVQWMDDKITDYPYIAIEPAILSLMAESFTLDERITGEGWESADTIRHAVNSLLVGELSYDPDWSGPGSCVLTAIDQAAGREDAYTLEPELFHSLDSTPGGYLADYFTWTIVNEEVPAGGYALRFQDDVRAFTVWSDDELLLLEQGDTATLFRGEPNFQWGGYRFSEAFETLLHYATDARYEYELNEVCSVDGSETDYEAVAAQLTRQWAQVLRERPGWYGQQAEDIRPGASGVFDAYYGEENPNFCFGMQVYLKLTEEQTDMWQAGSGLDEPIAEGPYQGWYSYGREACAAKGPDGNWHLTGINTGGSSADLPVDLYHSGGDFPTDTLISLYFLTSGESHDYRILARLAEKPLAEVQSALDALPAERREELRQGILRFMDKYPDSHNWSAADF